MYIYEDIFETIEIHLLYSEDINSPSYGFYICQYEYVIILKGTIYFVHKILKP